MKAVQTFWTNKKLPISQMTGGWLDPRYHFMSWALSASLLDQHFEETILHTDSLGKKILIDYLRLPYKEVRITQKNLDDLYPKNWWVMRKIHTYALIDDPFIHVDGDAFLWNGLPSHLLDKEIIVQNMQLGFGCYNMALDQLRNAGITLPFFFNGSHQSYDAVNMGIVGGTDHHFFKCYVSEIKSFYHLNLKGKSSEHLQKTGYLNTLLEECFFYQMAGVRKKQVTPLIQDSMEDNYGSLANCLDSRFPLTHLIGQNKQNIFHSKQIEFQLQQRFPDVYQRVTKFLDKFVSEKQHYHSHKIQDPFSLSNALCKTNGYKAHIHFGNASRAISKFKKEGKEDISGVLKFERTKYKTIINYIENKDKFIELQRNRNLLVSQISQKPLQSRLTDNLCYNVESPVLAMKSPYHSGVTSYSLVYDFESGYEHITHRSLDDMSLYILYLSQNTISVDTLLTSTLKRTANHANASSEIIRKIDVKIQELVLMGLLNYEWSTN